MAPEAAATLRPHTRPKDSRMASVLGDAKLDALLEGLHATSAAEEQEIERYFFHERTGPWNGMEPRDHSFMAGKLVALDRDKAEFCYMMARAIGARRIVEAGRSTWQPPSGTTAAASYSGPSTSPRR
jgi:hypothetical protein